MRRGVVTGSVVQGMAVTVPIGALTFLVMALATGNGGQIFAFSAIAILWLFAQGIVHFVLGRFCNYRSNQLMGVNLAAPVVQLQVPIAILIAVAVIGETFTVLQAIGSVLMVAGSFAVQHKSTRPAAAPSDGGGAPSFQPKLVSGYAFGFGAAFFYGLSPILARQAFVSAPETSTLAAGVIAYVGAMLAFSALLFLPGAWSSVKAIKSDNFRWFLAASVLVAISQAFVYASLAVAPLVVVTPILQLSLIFRLFLSQMINREHEVMSAAVIIGSAVAITGSMLVAIDTRWLVEALALPAYLARVLAYAIVG